MKKKIDMKKIAFFILAVVALANLSSCKQNSYAQQLKDEKKLIADFIEREHINVIYEEPADGVWGEKDYLDLKSEGYDNLYFHLVSVGDTLTPAIIKGDKVVLRYRRYTLDVNPDTVSYWTTAQTGYPKEFTYMTDFTEACAGWHYAIKHMRYTDSEAKIINPSKLGFSDAEQATVTPYGYDLKIKIKRY